VNANDRALTGFTMLGHATFHTYELVIPLFVVVWLDEFGLTPAVIGLVVGASYGLTGVGALPAGLLADAYSAKRLVLLCIAGMAGGFGLLATAQGLPTIVVGLLVWGAASSVYHPAGLALISKGVSERGRGFALHGMAGNVGIAAGPLATTVMLAFLDWETVAAVLAVPAFVVAGAMLFVDVDESGQGDDGDDDDDTPDTIGEFLDVSAMVVKSAFAFVFVVVMMNGLYYRGVLTFLPELLAGLETFQPIEIAGEPQEPANYVYSGLLAVGIAGQYVGGRLTERLSPGQGITYTFGALAVLAVLFLPLASMGAAPLLAVSAVLGFALFVVQPIYQAAVAEYTPEAARGLSYGYTYLGNFGVGALGAGLAGAILTYSNQTVLFLVFALIAGIASGIGVLLMRR